MMPPRLRKLALLVHIISSVGSLGAVISFLVLASIGLGSQAPELVTAVYPAMNLLARLVIFPLILASLATGLVQALGTPWGILRHYWVLAKLLLTAFAAIVLLLQLTRIDAVATLSAQTAFAGSGLWQQRLSLVVHASGGLLVLLLAATLSVYKPRGSTRYGVNRQGEHRNELLQ
jgi:hypothetical protein